MNLTAAQIKGRIKNIANKTNADPRLLMRIYMMDRFLERLSCSKYKDNFIIKGGILVTSMVGVSLRSTMDIDATIKNLDLTEDEMLKVVKEIADISLDDNVTFEVKGVQTIMDNFEYPGVRIEMNALIENMVTPLKIDISTNDVITPREIDYEYNLLIEDRNINLWAYNLETILAEKLETILSRNVLTTRLRDYYDVYTLTNIYRDQINDRVLKDAFVATTTKRQSKIDDVDSIINTIANNTEIKNLWNQYQSKYSYASEISFNDVITSIMTLAAKVKQ
ncbi:MAG: nucleotidyl transferase AbiEii/AbiGii toxin family protein [Erysipelotrichaceae bacterium]|nr:nucleotidyl transferase AbiEii/AbiGii toxin family protein [Erysipelotrichaceae bacterium]